LIKIPSIPVLATNKTQAAQQKAHYFVILYNSEPLIVAFYIIKFNS